MKSFIEEQFKYDTLTWMLFDGRKNNQRLNHLDGKML